MEVEEKNETALKQDQSKNPQSNKDTDATIEKDKIQDEKNKEESNGKKVKELEEKVLRTHTSYPTLAEHAHLSGHLSVQVDGTTSTYYDGNPILNKSGLMSFFPGRSLHWTDRYEGNSERITVAFDIHSKEFYEYDIFDYAKHHWIRI